MGKSQRDKGAGGERELCALLTDAFGFNIRRRLGQERDRAHDVDLPPFRMEVKRRARLGYLYDWMDQADDMREGRQVPAVAMRADGKGWLVLLRLDDFIRLAREEVAALHPNEEEGSDAVAG